MHVVLPTTPLIENFHTTANYLADSLGCPRVTLESSKAIIFTMVEEAVFNRLNWTQKYNNLEVLLRDNISFWATNPMLAPPEKVRATIKLYRIGIERPEMEIERHLDQVMGEEGSDAMWMVWHTLILGTDMVLERGSDFRVIEQERHKGRTLL